MSNCRYLIVTTVKNEEENLPNLIQSIVEQTIKPVLWVIVDDGSTDNTPRIIEDTKKQHDWILSFCLNSKERDLGPYLANVKRTGLEYGVEYCNKKGIYYDYFGIIDGDMILERSFFQKLIDVFKKNPKLGIASGGVYYDVEGELEWERVRENLPCGGDMLFRKRCYEEIGGIPITHSSDSVSIVKARLRGWMTKEFQEIKAIQTRETSSAEGLWKGYKIVGLSNYYLNYNPLVVMAKGLKFCLFKKPYYIGIAFLLGYFDSLLHRKEQINDKEVRKYFYWYKPREIWQYYWNAIKNKLAKHSGGGRK